VPTLSVTNAIAFANLKDPARDFGVVRMGGTVGWMLVSWPFVFLLAGAADVEHLRWIFLVAALVSFALAAYSLTLPHTPPRKAEAGVDALAWRRALGLLATPFVAVLFIVTFIDSVIHNGYFVMADAFLTNRVGIAGNLSMIVLSLGQLAEIGTMLILGPVLVKLGWKVTMIVGVLGHAARFAVFAFMADSVPVIISVQLLHGVCYAFFFATVYIFVDAAFPKDVRASAQGLFNLLILGVGNVVASFLFPALSARFSTPGADGAPVVDYTSLFLVPTGMALIAALLLAFAFNPPERAPAETPVT
jgi:MFS family permease